MNILKVLTQNKIIGNLGEKEAAKFLRRKGYRILERNYVADSAEIDIIAQNRDVTAFVEVKTRSVEALGEKQSRPAEAVTPEKQRHIIKAASHYIARHPSDTRLRLDVIEVYLEDGVTGKRVTKINHIESAFNINSAFDRGYAIRRHKEESNL